MPPSTTSSEAKSRPLINLAIFASGSGSNAQKILEYFSGHQGIRVGLVISNKADAGVLQRAEKFSVPALCIPGSKWRDPENILPALKRSEIDVIVLAGFLLLIPAFLLQHYKNRILNIHPALLPDFGGKGMYGSHVHKAVKEAGVTITGMTIHLIDEEYDRGEILFQAETRIDKSDTPEDIAAKVLKLEHKYFPAVIEDFCLRELKG